MSDSTLIEKDAFIREIKEICKELPFFSTAELESGVKIELNALTGITIWLTLDEKSKKIQFYFYLRTTSWNYEGERTDLHDIISVSLATFLRAYDITVSCALHDVPHPAIDNEGEIYARYIVPRQIDKELNHNYDSVLGLSKIKELLISISLFEHFFWSAVGCPCKECFAEVKPKFDYKSKISKPLNDKIIQALGDTDCKNVASRGLPNWNYYKDFEQLISVVNSEKLTTFFQFLSDKIVKKSTVISGVSGELLFDTSIKNFIPIKEKDLAKKILLTLEGKKTKISFIPLENILIAIGKKNILFFETLCGIEEFKSEREKVRKRHQMESKYLFSPKKFTWNDKVDPGEFEDLIRELLLREQDVVRVRKVGKTNEPDQGRDLIADWNLPTGVYVEGNAPLKKHRIVIQCKAYKESVNKSDFSDIRDTIENADCVGMLLVASGYLTTPLVNHLDKMRTKNNFWIDWWGRDEIEDRLSIHEDLLLKYSNICKHE